MNQLPEPFPPSWASDWGEDEYGLWIGLTYDGVRQGFRWIPPGRFLMGSPETEAGRDDNEIQHEVILTEGYWLADTPVTQALWQAVMGYSPSQFKGDERPVVNVGWDDAQRFITALNSEDEDLGFRLPTEAEWEHACRAGTLTPFSFGENITPEQVNFNGEHPYADGEKGLYRRETVEVKALPANDWGLFQMHGNVWEWCHDWYGAYPTESVSNPIGANSGQSRVLRGGSCGNYDRNVRAAYRLDWPLDYRDYNIGFRLARSPKVKPSK